MSFTKSNTIDASGGTITYVNGYKIHTFTTVGNSTFTVNSGSGSAKVLIVAGGGGGGYDRAAGGGGGGVVYYSSQSLSTGTYTVTVGDGGAGSTSWNGVLGTGANNGANGGNSSVTGLTVAVGGGGGGTYAAGNTGGSGGGGHGNGSYAGGSGTSGQGNAGGAGTSGTNSNSGGGGGAGGAGVAGGPSSTIDPAGGTGGVGLQYSISGTATYYGGGGGGSIAFDNFSGTSGNGLGGLGGGGNSGQTRGANGSPGTPNTGGGGGGGANIPQGSGGKGGSGIVIISYPYQTGMTIKTTNSPDIYLAPTGTYPSFNSTGGTAPTFLSDRVSFNPGAVAETSSSCQFVDFGAQTFPMTTSGFSFACKFQFTGSPGFFERIFCINFENINPAMSFKRNTTSDILLYGYFNPSNQYLADFGSYAQNTTYTIIGIYNPNVGTYGTLYYYKNGVLAVTFTPTAKLADFTSSNVFVGSGRTYSGDGALNADIFYLAMYKRVLSASEIAAITANGPSFGPTPIQFTSRPILPAVLTNPGNNFALVSGQTITVAQTALEPANGITWGFSPTASGLAVTSSTDYALNLVVNSTPILPNTYTVSATNKSGLTTVVQFSGSTQLIFGLFASPTATGTWYGFSYTIFTPQNSGVYPLVSLYGTSPLNSTVWDSGGVYSPGSGLPTSGASFNAYLPGTSTYGDYTRVQFSSGIVFSSVYIGLNGTNYNPISNVAVYGSNTGTAPWTQLFYGPSGLLESNYNTGTASFVKFTFTTTGSFTNYACQIPTVLPSHGNNPSTGCLYWST